MKTSVRECCILKMPVAEENMVSCAAAN